MANETYDNFETLKARLDEIVEAVADDELPLDDALTLYEEAVSLGLRATDLLEENISEADEAVEQLEQPAGEQAVDEQPASEMTTSNEGQ
ncbi:exodeoxyribonuclease VII small subunit [Adlercreutzia agrestimuris]|uniref:exodeoxyribonuclease VII small subunit n=1 Tax=Adlercreutzia agrestimuris TaxID=2941324 RepID=UPI00204193C3|nr:exodeoxyribonuclease VII small subunit [Adlercreutzia agrestimuris]